jgi:hypothetical protein
MTVFLISFGVFLLTAVALGLGLLLGRMGISGSCGGLNRIPGLEGACRACERPCPRRSAAIDQRMRT